MSDLIDRQAAIDVLNRHSVLFEFHLPHEFYEVKEELRGLPSAQPEWRTGEWKPFDRTWGRSIYHCTACGEAEDCPTEMGRVIWRFCPNCGAKMGGDAE